MHIIDIYIYNIGVENIYYFKKILDYNLSTCIDMTLFQKVCRAMALDKYHSRCFRAK